jgi:hypothetical protein
MHLIILKMNLINCAVPAASNQLQIKRFQEFILNNKISNNDIIVWQITGTERRHLRKKLGDIPNKPAKHMIFEESINYFDKEARIDYLCHSREVILEADLDQEQVLEDLLFSFVVAKQFTNKFLIIFGWDKALPEEYISAFRNALIEKSIDYIDDSIVSWSEKMNLPFDTDGSHPSEQGYISFARDCVIPKIKQLGYL